MKPRAALGCPLLWLLCGPAVSRAAEGMWTFDNLPRAQLQARYGFEPDAAWLRHAMRSTLRLADGCSASFVSAQGLVLSNAHCVLDCVQNLSARRDHVNEGFVARTRGEELRCPSMELNRLEEIRDVSASVTEALAGKSGTDYVEARRALQAQLESECVGDQAPRRRCDLVELYGGAQYQLYRYQRYDDVRLVFWPEYAAAFFGGDPDNFNFPRYTLDAALLRAYQDGQALQPGEHLRLQPRGAQPGELLLSIGNPGHTDRQLTVAQLQTLRALRLPQTLLYYAERRAMLAQYSRAGARQANYAQADLTFTENSLKVYRAQLQALNDDGLFERKRAEEAALRKADAGLTAFDDIARAEQTLRRLYLPYQMLEQRRAFFTPYFKFARDLLRAAAERERPNAQRLPEFQDAALPTLQRRLFSASPLRDAYEETKLAWSLAKLREALGADDPLVQQVLRGQSPDARASQLLRKTRLGDVEYRRRLWQGGAQAVAASDDPFIELARALDAPSRELRRQMEADVEAPEALAAQAIARLRFAQYGRSLYPDASFTLRLSYGELRGWEENGRSVAPFTDFAAAFAHQTGAAPFLLPESWNRARARLALDTPLNFVSSHDIVGGNSGSPLLNRQGELAGLLFDGNRHSIAGAYEYDEALNRSIALHPAALLQALTRIYAAPGLAAELLDD
ncbi:Peptidase S46 [Solimonas aquatica]|uniref:Dipeptidyl-peptidase n=1 Tax=Solimonas aquatica TaxID=489703 RepID=A0A1H9FLM0_9GAMM|nr:S46 family peptidase [Solimonas aquatica]SEQ38759.1 Peptidase S46 [Solimonas aquatica]